MIPLHPLACRLFVIIAVTVLQELTQGHRQQREVHGDPLGRAVHRRELILRVQWERGNVDRVPPVKPLLAVGWEGYRARRRGVGGLKGGGGRTARTSKSADNVTLNRIRGVLHTRSTFNFLFCRRGLYLLVISGLTDQHHGATLIPLASLKQDNLTLAILDNWYHKAGQAKNLRL